MEKMNDLRDLLTHEIEDLYSVEEQIIEALPKMIEKANNKSLKDSLKQHLKITEEQKKRLDKIQTMMTESNEENGNKKKGFLSALFGGTHVCKGMKGIIDEGNKIMAEDMNPEVMDAAIIACAQKVEHYEICGYGTARTFARELNLEQIAKMLEQTLNEEYEADILLTELAVNRINQQAEDAGTSGDRSASGSNQRDTKTGSREEIVREEMEMEPANNRTATSKSGLEKKPASSKRGGQPKSAGSAPRSSSGERETASSKKSTSSSRSTKSTSKSSSNGRSSTGDTGRGRK